MLNNIKAMWQVMHDIKLPAEKEELVKKRLKRVLVSAYKHVPYYRDIMKNIGYDPIRDYRGPQDLKKFPVTTRKDLKANDISMFLNEGMDVKNLYATSTTGSTGIPLKIFLSYYERAFRIAKWIRVLFINKYSIRDKVLNLASPLRHSKDKTVLQKFGLLRRLTVNYLLPANKQVEIFLNYKPHVLFGNRSNIDLLALELIKSKIKPKDLKLVIAGAEIIHESNRNLYRQAFGIEPVEYYGSEEMGIMAYETPTRDGLSLSDDLTYFEFLDKDNNPVLSGEPGRIVVTDLLGTTMPFIRYDQGDLVTIKVIIGSDGKLEKRLSKIIGRDNDYLVLLNGKMLLFSDFYNILFEFEDILQLKVIQKTKNYYQIKIAANQEYFTKIEGQIKDLLNTKFLKNCSFEISRVDFIEPDPSGKLSMLVSEVKND